MDVTLLAVRRHCHGLGFSRVWDHGCNHSERSKNALVLEVLATSKITSSFYFHEKTPERHQRTRWIRLLLLQHVFPSPTNSVHPKALNSKTQR